MEVFALIFVISFILFFAFSIKDAKDSVYCDLDDDSNWPLRDRILAAVFMISGAICLTWLVATGQTSL